MRILMVMNMPWKRDLGGPRIQIELADELTRQGHTVDKFSLEDAFPPGPEPWLTRGLTAKFSFKVHDFLGAKHPGYDVIDALQGTLLIPIRPKGARPVIAIRSIGLVHFHNPKRERMMQRRSDIRARVGSMRRRLVDYSNKWAAERSFDLADTILVPNRAEETFLKKSSSWGQKVRLIPHALSERSFHDLQPDWSKRREVSSTVCFVGSWGPLKGSRDLGHILEAVQAQVPNAKFLFLGTRCPVTTIMEDLDVNSNTSLEVIDRYDPSELPSLLLKARVGVFPSYTEGSPSSVIEQLAAGIPVVAYDVPGPQDLLEPLRQVLLVPAGDKKSLSDRISMILMLGPDDYSRLSYQCRSLVEDLRWPIIARRTLAAYKGISLLG